LLFRPAHEVADLVAAGELSAAGVLEAALARVAQRNPALNAFITVTADQAREEAKAADRELRAGGRRSPLQGLPLALKDLFATRGVRTTGGSRVLGDWVPDFDATVVRRLREAGLITVGKTGTPEFAGSPVSANPHYGPVKNPWNLKYDTGASSSGTGAAIADGMAFVGPGTDTGGSIRIPAAGCGLVGLKPTYGRVSLRGVLPLCTGQDHVGPMARTVRDAALLLDLLAGFDPDDATSADVPYEAVTPGLEAGIEGLRVAYLTDDGQGPVDPEIAAAVTRGVGLLSDAGARVEEVRLPMLADFLPHAENVWAAEVAADHARWLPERAAELDPRFRSFVEAGARMGATDLLKSQRALRLILRDVERALGPFELAAGPTLPCFVPPAGEQRDELVRFTAPWDFNGWPAASVPVGRGSQGLPIGIQLIGRPWSEGLVLRAARAVEAQFALSFPPDQPESI